jgi:capsular polysaccharide biosynthesis protein
MELRQYAQILLRRWWLPVLLALLVGIFSLIQLRPWQPSPPLYAASMRLLVGVLPATEADVTAYDPRYYAWLTSEYLVDDFTEVVRSALFAQNVSNRLAGQGINVPTGAIQGSAATGEQHRIITLSLTWGDEAQVQAMAEAAAAELSENAATYFQALGTDGAGVTLIDGPTVGAVSPSLRNRLELPLRVLLGLIVGIGLVFLWDYLDTSVRDRKEVEALGLTVIAAIPKTGKKAR